MQILGSLGKCPLKQCICACVFSTIKKIFNVSWITVYNYIIEICVMYLFYNCQIICFVVEFKCEIVDNYIVCLISSALSNSSISASCAICMLFVFYHCPVANPSHRVDRAQSPIWMPRKALASKEFFINMKLITNFKNEIYY